MSKQQFLFTGTGGQGLILAAIIWAEAAVQGEQNVVQSQSYGPEARGGASKAEVIISDQAIYYPKVSQADYVLTMSREAYKKYGLNLRDEVNLVVDDTYVPEIIQRPNLYCLPISRIARSEFGSEQSANIVALGAVAALSGLLPLSMVRQAVAQRVPKGTMERNLEAFEIGWQLGLTATARQGGAGEKISV